MSGTSMFFDFSVIAQRAVGFQAMLEKSLEDIITRRASVITGCHKLFS